MVVFGHLGEIDKCLSNLKVKNALIITDDPLFITQPAIYPSK